MTIGRSTAGINKTVSAGRMDAYIGFTRALRRVFPTTVVRASSHFVAGSNKRPCATEYR